MQRFIGALNPRSTNKRWSFHQTVGCIIKTRTPAVETCLKLLLVNDFQIDSGWRARGSAACRAKENCFARRGTWSKPFTVRSQFQAKLRFFAASTRLLLLIKCASNLNVTGNRLKVWGRGFCPWKDPKKRLTHLEPHVGSKLRAISPGASAPSLRAPLLIHFAIEKRIGSH